VLFLFDGQGPRIGLGRGSRRRLCFDLRGLGGGLGRLRVLRGLGRSHGGGPAQGGRSDRGFGHGGFLGGVLFVDHHGGPRRIGHRDRA
jgi:hypothetical protein